MIKKSEIDALLDRKDELSSQGIDITPEELCRDCPELLDELKQRIDALKIVDDAHDTDGNLDNTAISPDGNDVIPEGRYRVMRPDKPIGEGGLGKVYDAQDCELGRTVAVKTMKGWDRDSHGRRRFVLEARLTARLEHPGVVPVYGMGEDKEDVPPYYAMRKIDGATLATKLKDMHSVESDVWSSPQWLLDVRRLLQNFIHVCQTVAYAHDRGVIHRDIKPANIMLGPYGETLLLDWGLAKSAGQPEAEESNSEDSLQLAFADPESRTIQGAIKGSPAYMSPEQASGELDRIGPLSDIYCLGATLYVILTGKRPYEGPHKSVLEQVKKGSFPPPRQVEPRIPGALEAICVKAMALRPEDRFATAKDFAKELERWLGDEPVTSWTEPRSVRIRRWMKRHRVWVAAISAALIAALLGLGAVAAQQYKANREKKVLIDDLEVKGSELEESNASLTVANTKEREATALATERAKQLGESNKALDKAKNEAVALADEKTKLADTERELRKRAETMLYLNQIGSADTAWQNSQIGASQDILKLCQPEYRGWEWNYLERRRKAGFTQLEGILNSVNAVAFSPDNRLLATAAGGKLTTWFQLAEAARPFPFEFEGHTGEVRCLAFNPQGDRIASGSGQNKIEALSDRSTAAGEVKIWDVSSRNAVLTIRHANVNAVAYNSDGSRLATAGDDGVINIWNAQTGESEQELGGHQGAIRSVVFATDGKSVISGGDDGTIRVWDVMTGKEQTSQPAHGIITGIAVSPDQKHFATSGWDQTVRVWELPLGKQPVAILRGHKGIVTSVTYLGQKGEYLATGGNDATVRIWDPSDGTELRLLRGHRRGVNCVAGSNKNIALVSGGESFEVNVWSLSTSQDATVCFGHEHHVHRLAFSPDGKRVASTSDDKTVRVWEAETGKELLVFREHTSATVGVCFSLDGRLIASGSDSLQDGEVLVWEAETGKVIHRLNGNANLVSCVAISPDSKWLASAGQGSEFFKLAPDLKIWNLQTGELVLTLAGQKQIESLAFSPDGKILASASQAGTVRLRDARTGQEILILEGAGNSLAFHPDGKSFATAVEFEGDVRVWDLTGKTLSTLPGHGRKVFSLAYSFDGKRLAVGGFDEVELWDTTVGIKIVSLKHSGFAGGLAFSRDGRYLAAAGGPNLVPGRVTIWDGSPVPASNGL